MKTLNPLAASVYRINEQSFAFHGMGNAEMDYLIDRINRYAQTQAGQQQLSQMVAKGIQVDVVGVSTRQGSIQYDPDYNELQLSLPVLMEWEKSGKRIGGVPFDISVAFAHESDHAFHRDTLEVKGMKRFSAEDGLVKMSHRVLQEEGAIAGWENAVRKELRLPLREANYGITPQQLAQKVVLQGDVGLCNEKVMGQALAVGVVSEHAVKQDGAGRTYIDKSYKGADYRSDVKEAVSDAIKAVHDLAEKEGIRLDGACAAIAAKGGGRSRE